MGYLSQKRKRRMRDKQERESFFLLPFLNKEPIFQFFLVKEKICGGDFPAQFTGMIMIDR